MNPFRVDLLLCLVRVLGRNEYKKEVVVGTGRYFYIFQESIKATRDGNRMTDEKVK